MRAADTEDARRRVASALGVDPGALAVERRDWCFVVHAPGGRVVFVPLDAAGAARLAVERASSRSSPLASRSRCPARSTTRPISTSARSSRGASAGRRTRAVSAAPSAPRWAASRPSCTTRSPPATPTRSDSARRRGRSPRRRCAELDGRLPSDLDAALAAVTALVAEPTPAADVAVCHNDLGSHNFAFDPATGARRRLRLRRRLPRRSAPRPEAPAVATTSSTRRSTRTRTRVDGHRRGVGSACCTPPRRSRTSRGARVTQPRTTRSRGGARAKRSPGRVRQRQVRSARLPAARSS